MSWRRSQILSLPMDMASHDPSNLRTLDVSGSKIHASFGAGAAAPTKLTDRAGYTFNSAASQYMTGLCQGAFNQPAITICFLFNPSFAADDGNIHAFIDTDLAARYVIQKLAANVIDIEMGGIAVLGIALASYQPYWKINQYNTMVTSCVSGNNRAILNTTPIATSATAWAVVNPVSYWLGCRFNATSFYAGTMNKIEIFPFAMTKTQADDWAIRAMQRVNNL